ncbi:MAG: aspartate-semialdehyde dehydrogenase [Fimbriimonadaceae bacterium]
MSTTATSHRDTQQGGLRVAILGATGAVGVEFLRLLEQRKFGVAALSLLASERSAGKILKFKGEGISVTAVRPDSFDGIDVAFFSAGASLSRENAPRALNAGAYVIDNSSAFRMDDNVPLIVPEINIKAVKLTDRLISVPNCSAIILLMAVAPLRKLGVIERLIVSTYQSASGGGAGMMRRLMEETRASIDQVYVEPASAHPPYAFNLFSHNTPINALGQNEEEAKVIAESRKILDMPDLRLNVTCIRVPVLRAHSQSVTVEFSGKAPCIEDVRATLAEAPGVRVVDDRAANDFPTPVMASGQDDVLVGRIRTDPSHASAISIFIAGDQLLKGAALNAVQIAEAVVQGARAADEVTAR